MEAIHLYLPHSLVKLRVTAWKGTGGVDGAYHLLASTDK